MLPILPLVVLVGLGATAYVVTRKKEPIPGGGAVGPQGPVPVMTGQMRQAFETLMSSGNADGMEQSATALEPFGFMNEAAQLRQQAAKLRAAAKAQDPNTQATINLATNSPASPAQAIRDVGDVDAPGFFPGAASTAILIPADNVPLPAFPIPVPPPPAQAALPSFARVTTHDSAPEGDLAIRAAPNGAIIPGVGAEKDGVVMVLKADALGDGVWSQVVWAGGNRLGPAAGFAKAAFLRPSAVGPQGTAIAGYDKYGAMMLAPSGARLRKAPSLVADFRTLVGNAEQVQVIRTVQGPKLESFSPGRGGWALVKYKKLEGWLPLEWLVRA